MSTSFVYRKSTILVMNLQDTCARGDKYSSKLDIFRSLIRIFETKNSKILSLALKNIKVGFIFLARLFVSLYYREYTNI